ncbi:metal-sulfur cluster assembly factor [Rufibacter sp. LB8]|uniref:metal-sulfur cluster assembly factor n=1 Tax=Rufibacter sp. LB8 TaxID=2777781 RepID=UPI00178C5080|nr:metal-sulfur cluster assembly factor [Rufibacter sp. LB8]
MQTHPPDTGQLVLEALRQVIDPEIGINIVDLGLVYQVSLDQEVLGVDLTLTTPGCPMSSTIITAVEHILARRFPELTVQVNLVWSPMWTPDMITDEGRRQLR